MKKQNLIPIILCKHPLEHYLFYSILNVCSLMMAVASHDARRESSTCKAEIAQLGERQTEDLKVPGSIPGLGIFNAV